MKIQITLLTTLFISSSCASRGTEYTDSHFIDFGNCTEKMGDSVDSCLRQTLEEWKFDGDFETIRSDFRTYCCAVWDYMYCLIRSARDVCTTEELDLIIKSSDNNQTVLEYEECQYYTRDSIFVCGVYWYEIMLLVIFGVAAILAVAMIVVNNCKQNRIRPQKFEVVKVYV